jgi:CSLREA domain-containing protein
VNITTDELNSDGDCSLREAIRAANTNLPVDACAAGSDTETDTIVVPAGTYTLTITSDPQDVGLGGDLDILNNTAAPDLSITGAGAASTIIQACPVDQKTAACPAGQGIDDRIFDVQSAAVSMSGLTIRNGRSDGVSGGGIKNQFGGTIGATSVVTLTDCVVTDNIAVGVGADGGGIVSFGGIVNLLDMTVRSMSIRNFSCVVDGTRVIRRRRIRRPFAQYGAD